MTAALPGKKYLRPGMFLLGACLLLAGCGPVSMPERNGIFSSLPEAVAAYRDYLNLERRGVQVLMLKLGSDEVTATLPFYLFTLGREFERLGKPQEAVKIYLRLQIRYTLLDEENSMGRRTENRLHWILGDKHWFRPTAEALTTALRQALREKNPGVLEELMSRDFGFGEDAGGGERLPIDYRWAVKMIAERWAGKRNITVNLISQDASTVRLKAAGWNGEHKVWNLVLRRRDNPKGWEWDTITWGE